MTACQGPSRDPRRSEVFRRTALQSGTVSRQFLAQPSPMGFRGTDSGFERTDDSRRPSRRRPGYPAASTTSPPQLNGIENPATVPPIAHCNRRAFPKHPATAHPLAPDATTPHDGLPRLSTLVIPHPTMHLPRRGILRGLIQGWPQSQRPRRRARGSFRCLPGIRL